MLNVKISRTEQSVNFSGSVPDLMSELTTLTKALRNGVSDEASKKVFDFFLKTAFADCVFANSKEEFDQVLDDSIKSSDE